MNKNDLRYIKTEKLIIDAFKENVNKNGFEKTTVAMICSTASISRNTFYFHYIDKYDLLDHLFLEFEKKLTEKLYDYIIEDLKKYVFHDSVVWVYKVIEENKDLVFLLINCSRTKMIKLLQKNVFDIPSRKLVSNYDHISQDIQLVLVKSYLLNAMVGYIEQWLAHYDEITTQQIIDIMEELCGGPLQYHLDLLFNNKELIIRK